MDRKIESKILGMVDDILCQGMHLEQIFRRTQECLRRAQCELPLTTTHGDRLRDRETAVIDGLQRIGKIQILCADARKLLSCS